MQLKEPFRFAANLLGGDYQVKHCSAGDLLPNTGGSFDLEGAPGNDELLSLLNEATEPVFVGRWGSTEFETMVHGLDWMPWYEKKFNKRIRWNMFHMSGFFSAEDKRLLSRFAKDYATASSHADALEIWGIPGERYAIEQLCPTAHILHSRAIAPWKSNTPWTSWLAGKRVLAISPFSVDILSQYAKRESLHQHPLVLPEFSLRAVSSVQTQGQGDTRFATWYEALQYQKGLVAAHEFDVLLAGCGAYGMLLCDFVKQELGKSSIYMGSGLQLLFGIRGRRWDKSGTMDGCMNEHWIYPSGNLGNQSVVPDADVYGK